MNIKRDKAEVDPPRLLPHLLRPQSLAWGAAFVLVLNTLWFVLRTTSPVIQQDAWYFLSVFLSKAINGTLGIADFFVKRKGIDHAQPMFKLVMLFEWRYFDLDFVVEGVVGLLAAVGSALVLRRLIMSDQSGGRGYGQCLLAWVAICGLLFSLNEGGQVWIWPLVALEHLTILLSLVFFVVVWRARQAGRYDVVAIAAIVLGVFNDDSALVAVLAVALMLLVSRWRNHEGRESWPWKELITLAVAVALVRIGYAWAPIVGGSNGTSLLTNLPLLIAHLRLGDWWTLLATPLTMPLNYLNPAERLPVGTWAVVRSPLAVLLMLAHVMFWRRLFRGHWGQRAFVAGCLMLLFYGWVAGIVLGRVATSGSAYIDQPRYVIRFTIQLVALLLMWTEPPVESVGRPSRKLLNYMAALGACLLLVLQVKQAGDTWHQRRAYVTHYADLATMTDAFVNDPVHFSNCTSELPVCGWPKGERKELARLLAAHRLNIFSPRVQRWHPYLPKLSPQRNIALYTVPTP